MLPMIALSIIVQVDSLVATNSPIVISDPRLVGVWETSRVIQGYSQSAFGTLGKAVYWLLCLAAMQGIGAV